MIKVINIPFGKWEYISEFQKKEAVACGKAYAQSLNISAAEGLKALRNDVESFDDLYEACEDYALLYETGAKRAALGDSCFFCLGGAGENGFVSAMRKLTQVRVIAGADEGSAAAQKAAGYFETGAYKTLSYHCLENADIDGDFDMAITDIDGKMALFEIKTYLSGYYKNMDVLFVSEKEDRLLPLYEIDRIEDTGIGACLYVPKGGDADKERYTYRDLIRIMKRLRGKGGCPWDAEQTHKSLASCVIEEAYEVAEAIDKDDTDAMYDELGDLLLQVVFHARIAEETGEFDLTDITNAICAKLILRHPHIFGNVKAEDAATVLKNWEAIKKEEKGLETYTDTLRDIPKNLCALMKSAKIQKKAAAVGFDFGNAEEALKKAEEELGELKSAIASKGNIEEECGDALFALINVLRLLKINPETVLLHTNSKFISRFEYIEKHAQKDMRDMNIEEMDALWEEAKAKETQIL